MREYLALLELGAIKLCFEDLVKYPLLGILLIQKPIPLDIYNLNYINRMQVLLNFNSFLLVYLLSFILPIDHSWFVLSLFVLQLIWWFESAEFENSDHG